MKNFTNFILTFTITLFVNVILIAQGDCVIVIQGARDTPTEAFFKNSTDNFVSAMGSGTPAQTITVLRPMGEMSMLGATPARTEQNYDNKADLIKKIKEALCKEECKDVIITLIGHGMGGNGINQPPPNKDAGGMKVGTGNSAADFLTAPEIAALIDSCKKSAKIIASQCFAESMINGICKVILNKGLIGVAIGSSLWNEESFGTGTTDANMTYEFLMHFLKDYYLIIGNPNVMEQIKKAAEELKKKNEEYNKQVAAENKAREDKIKDCAKMLEDLKKQRDALDKQIADTKAAIENAKAAKGLLERRKALEESYDGAKGKEKSDIKKQLDKNMDSLKKVGVKNLPGGKLEKRLAGIDAEIATQDKAIEDLTATLDKLNEEWMAVNKKYVDKEFELDKLNNTPPKSPIPAHLPLNEIIIHEAFKSAKALTKTSTPVEPVPPKATGQVDVPKTPPTDITKGGERFIFYKVKDEKTGKCVVVGYRADKLGNPIGPIKSIECDLECKSIKFSFVRNDSVKIVEATLQENNTYKYKVDGVEVANVVPTHKKINLIKPGELLTEAYCQVEFNTIPDVFIPGWEIANALYDPEISELVLNMFQGTNTHQVQIQFMPHEDVMIRIDDADPYLESETRRFTMIDQAHHSQGKLAFIEREGNLIGSLQQCSDDSPVAITGQLSEDMHRFMLMSMNTSMPFQAFPSPVNSSENWWNLGTQQGVLYQDIQNEPYIVNFNLNNIPNGPNLMQWQYLMHHMTDAELEMFMGTRIIAYDQLNVFRMYDLPPGQNTFIDQQNNPNQPVEYYIYPVMFNNAYCVPYEGILFDEFGQPTCAISQPVIVQNNRKSDQPEEKDIVLLIPNPFKDKTELHLLANGSGIAELRIFNLEGAILKELRLYTEKGWNRIPISKDDLKNPGIYFYELKTINGLLKGKIILTD
jgi:hypothetical protein